MVDGINASIAVDSQFAITALERSRQCSTASWSDALDGLGIRGVAEGLVMRTGNGRIAGRILTVKFEVSDMGSWGPSEMALGRVFRAAGDADIIVMDSGGAAVSTFGGLAATAAAKAGVRGVIIDGACRDIDDIEEAGVTVVSRHVTPTSGRSRTRLVALEDPVTCGGVLVNGGDFVIADRTGVVFVPADLVAQALERAEECEASDVQFGQALSLGDFQSATDAVRHA